MAHPTIKPFLAETSLDPLVSNKRLRVEYRESSEVKLVRVLAMNCFGRGKVRCTDPSKVEAVFRSENVIHRQQATLGWQYVVCPYCTFSSGRVGKRLDLFEASSNQLMYLWPFGVSSSSYWFGFNFGRCSTLLIRCHRYWWWCAGDHCCSSQWWWWCCWWCVVNGRSGCTYPRPPSFTSIHFLFHLIIFSC